LTGKKTKEGKIVKQNQFKKLFQIKKAIKKWWSNLKDEKKWRGMK
jgi:hypothetical protein